MNLNRLVIVLIVIVGVVQVSLYYRDRTALRARTLRDIPQGVMVDIEGIPIRGTHNSSILLLEASDYECPYCLRHHSTVGREVEDKLIRTGKVRYAFVHYPLLGHENARMLAIGAICAYEQGHFWDIHDPLFSEAPRAEAAVVRIAGRIPIDVGRFETCLSSSSALQELNRQATLVDSTIGSKATPTFALGVLEGDSRVKVHKVIIGLQSFKTFREAVDELYAINQARFP